MGTDITLRATDLQAVLSSMDCVALRRISLGTLQHPGQPLRKYLAGGLKLTVEHRAAIEAKVAVIEAMAAAPRTRETRESALGLIGKMLLAYPMAGGTAEAGKARGEAYLDALDDVPPWAIAEAIRQWHRGECGPDHNYRFAPAPAELRYAVMQILQPAKQALAHFNALLSALTIERAMDPAPLMTEIPTATPRLRAV